MYVIKWECVPNGYMECIADGSLAERGGEEFIVENVTKPFKCKLRVYNSWGFSNYREKSIEIPTQYSAYSNWSTFKRKHELLHNTLASLRKLGVEYNLVLPGRIQLTKKGGGVYASYL